VTAWKWKSGGVADVRHHNVADDLQRAVEVAAGLVDLALRRGWSTRVRRH
jgi:hypothetical protein